MIPELNNKRLYTAIKLVTLFICYHGWVTDVIAQSHDSLVIIPKVNDNNHSTPSNIKGLVIDYHSGKAVRGIIVKVDNMPYTDTSDKFGRFELHLSGSTPDTLMLVAINGNSEDAIIFSERILKTDISIESRVKLYRFPKENLDEVILYEYKLPLVPMDGERVEQLNDVPPKLLIEVREIPKLNFRKLTVWDKIIERVFKLNNA